MCTCIETITESHLVKARKDYRDSNREWIMSIWDEIGSQGLSVEEIALIEKAMSENWVIKKGDIYDCCVLKNDDGLYTWRSKPGLNEICHKYDLYPEC